LIVISYIAFFKTPISSFLEIFSYIREIINEWNSIDYCYFSCYIYFLRRNKMINRLALVKEIETLPSNCIGEVVDFVAWIKHHKLSQISETMLLSEKALSKDWDTPEEDEAWASL